MSADGRTALGFGFHPARVVYDGLGISRVCVSMLDPRRSAVNAKARKKKKPIGVERNEKNRRGSKPRAQEIWFDVRGKH